MLNNEVAARRTDAISRGVGVTTQVYADKAENAEIWDVEGRRYIDFAAGIAVDKAATTTSILALVIS